ncbi:retrovirus-related Pol polyprotein from transposon 297 [Trichonephila clavipes]|nr:retrovirus-related Pol polyprotein from transposon 297 [Trichonephila clavipes]
MSALDLRSGYFQIAVNPSDIVKTAFVTKNGTYAFRRMPFSLSGAVPNFQKAIDIVLKPMIGKFVNVYMGDVIISSPSFTQHVKHLKEVFRLLHEAGRDVQIKVNDWVLVATHPLSSATRKVVAKFKPKFEGPYRVLDVKNNNVVIWKARKRLTINVDQVRIYRHRKCDETEIGTGSSDNGSLCDESSGFDRVQRISYDSRDGKKKGSEVKRELEEKGLSFRSNQGEKHTNKTNKREPLIRSIPSSWSEKDRMIKERVKIKVQIHCWTIAKDGSQIAM